jgi:hypothetical protein
MESVPMDGKVPKCQNKCCWWRLLRPSDHFMNGGHCWLSLCSSSREQTNYSHPYSWQAGHGLLICILNHPQGPQVSQHLCKVGAKAAYTWAQMGMCGNVHATFAAMSWRRGTLAMDCHVTSNETWVHHCESARKHQSMEWKHISLHRTKKIKSVPSGSKVMLTLF